MWLKHDPTDEVERALKKRAWKYLKVDDQTIITGVGGLPSGYTYFISIRHEGERKTVLFLFNPLEKDSAHAFQSAAAGRPPVMRVHPTAGHSGEQVAGVCEILMHRNYGIVLGNFERDCRDGEIRFRIPLPYCDTNLTVEQVNWCIEMATSTLEMTMPRIEGFLSGRITFEEAMGGGSGGRPPMMV